jgi:hypothetical protein
LVVDITKLTKKQESNQRVEIEKYDKMYSFSPYHFINLIRFLAGLFNLDIQ